jgi:4-hydroxy-tetrahydrodipicolinate reductase
MKVGIVGYRGKMGQALLAEAEKHDDISIAILHSRYFQNETDIPITDSVHLLVEECDIVVDFSRPDTSLQVIELSIKKGVAVVCGTTGFTTKEMDYIRKLSGKGRIFYSANMSLGVAILSNAIELVVEKLIKNDIVPDISILERHHKHKVDKPSGTAISLASVINHKFHNIIPDILSLRYGSNIGEHEVIIANETEVITLKHQATDRRVFAAGAIAAAKFLYKQKQNKLYTISDIIC